VSKGPPPVRVPNVVDRGRAEAVRILRDAGLRVSVEEPLGVTPLDRVLRQSPGGGDTVPKGSVVVLQIV
jgi:eukaryotic-like serine/threonine-protein kinase